MKIIVDMCVFFFSRSNCDPNWQEHCLLKMTVFISWERRAHTISVSYNRLLVSGFFSFVVFMIRNI